MGDSLICKMISFNCKSVKRSAGNIMQLCDTADIITLQETWLLPHDIPFLGSIHNDFEYTGKSAVDTSEGNLRGRPYGGVAILWRKNIFSSISVIECVSSRIAAAKFEIDNRTFMVFSVYMPTECMDNLPEFTECLSEISAIIENSEVESVYILGDFNAHPVGLFGTEIKKFCSDQSWNCADIIRLGIESESYTFVSEAHGCRRWLDHCLVTQSAWSTVMDVKMCYNVFWSDHLPIELYCDLKIVRPKFAPSSLASSGVIWGERTSSQITEYYEYCNSRLKHIDFPEECGLCADKQCYEVAHRKIIDNMYIEVVTILKAGAIASYKSRNRSTARGGKIVVGWNQHVSHAHREARYKLQMWMWHGKPAFGNIYDEMIESRKIFKSRLKWCQTHQEQIKMDIIANHRSMKNFSKFWKSTNKLNLKPSLPVSIDGVSESKEIANIFKDTFKVVSPLGQAVPQMINTRSGSSSDYCSVRFSAKQVKEVLYNMSRGKSPGHDGLSIEHLRYAGVHLPRVLALLYSLCVGHAYLPCDFMKTIVVPIIKNRTGDIADKGNYRPISLATIMAKVFDRLLDRHLDCLQLHDAQFGFRAGLSTESAILSLKHTVRYYVDRKTSVYACFLDLSKAFDLVNYNILWKKLRNSNLPKEICSVFEYWYNNQINYVKWAGTFSDEYGLECGVRQGGITSPKLFNLYVNELIEGLSSMHVGCYIDGICVNNISYADDMVLLAPSVSAIRKLLNFCETYAISHGLKYNVKKSEFMVFTRKPCTSTSVPAIMLNGTALKRVTHFKYLGHILTEHIKDDMDIERERRALAVRANMVARRFARCSKDVKVTLFKAFCQTFYTSSLWTDYTQKSVNTLRVQYNNAFRMLMGLPRYCSATAMFMEARTDSFVAIIRKRIASLLSRLRGSRNSILKTIADKFNCPMYIHSVRMLVK